MSDKDDNKPPKPERGDVIHTIVRAGIAAVPVLGGPALELFNFCVAPPLQIRQTEWMNTIADKLYTLESLVEGFKIEDLIDNPLFISVLLQATTIAIRNHQSEKLESLRNAVANTALGIDIKENIQMLFLTYIDYLTPLHVKILKYFQDPTQWITNMGIPFNISVGGASDGLEAGLPELTDQRQIFDPLVDDLNNRGLLKAHRRTLHTRMSRDGILSKRTSELGDKFLRYIRAN